MKRFLQTVVLSMGVTVSLYAQSDWDFAVQALPGTSMYGEDVTHDIYGNIYVVGVMEGNTDFGSGFNRSGQGGTDIFVAKYDFQGNIQWVTSMGSVENEVGNAIHYDRLHDQVIIGGYIGTLDLNVQSASGLATADIPALGSGSSDIFVGLLDAGSGEINGDLVLGGDGGDGVYDLAFDDQSGQIFISGEFHGSDVFPAYFGDSGGSDIELFSTFNGSFYSQDAFVAALNSDLTTAWAYNIGGSGYDAAYAITYRDDYGEVVVAGNFDVDLVFNHNSGSTSAINSDGNSDVFVGHYDSDGNLTASTTAGGVDFAYVFGVAMGRYGEVYLAGRFDGDADFGGTGLTSAGDFDIFLAREVDGNWEWAVKAGSSGLDQADAVEVTSDDQPVITGWVSGNATFGSGVAGQVNISGTGSETVFLAEYNQYNGQLDHVLSASGTGGDLSYGVTVYGDYAYIVGTSSSADAQFGGTVLNAGGVSSLFVAGANGFGPFQATSISFPGLTNGALEWGDFDSDGNLDVFLQGTLNPTDFTASDSYVYQGNGSDFQDAAIGVIPFQSFGDVAWGDYDGDGDVDMALSGWEGPDGVNVKNIFRNDGGTAWVNINAPFPQFDGSSDFGDYDQDGDLDILFTSFESGTWQTYIYRNDGSDTFTDISLTIDQSKHAEFVDYDNDGDIDIFLDGDDDLGLTGTTLWENIDGTFSQVASFPEIFIAYDVFAWGDYDNDGDQDLALTGQESGNHPFYLLKNEGGGTFTNVNTIIPGFERGALDWGDFDNDGDLDLIASGTGVDLGGTDAFVVENLGADNFFVQDFGLEPLSDATASWADYNNDGYLDFLILGTDESNTPRTILYRNFGSYVGNTPPDAPSNPNATPNGFDVRLEWSWPGDETPPDGLTYNVRVGTFAGGNDVVASGSLENGMRLTLEDGNAGSNTFFELKNLPAGSYFWDVQAIDGHKVGGTFNGSTFEITGALESLNFWSYPHSNAQIELKWADIEGETSYEIHRSSDGGNNFSVVGTLDAEETRFRDTGLQPNTVYHYMLRAYDGIGGSVDSDVIVEATFSPFKNTRFANFQYFGGANLDMVRDVASDASGNMYFYGDFQNAIDFDGQGLATSGTNVSSGFLVKTDLDLNVTWSRMIEPSEFMANWGVDVSPSDEVYVTGYFQGTINFAGEALVSEPGQRNLFVAKYDTDGNEIWIRKLTSAAPNFAYGVSAGEDGYVYVSGEVQDDYTFASVDQIAYGPVLLKFDSDGNEIWSVTATNDESWLGFAYNVEANGSDVVISGSFGATTDFGGATLTSTNGNDVFVAKYTNSGSLVWANEANGPGGDDGTLGLALDQDGDVIVSGYFNGAELDHFGGGITSNKGTSYDAFLSKISSTGTHLWTRTLGTIEADLAYAVETDGNNVFVAGFTAVYTDSFDGKNKVNGTNFIASFDTDGTIQWLDITQGYAWTRALKYANAALYSGTNFIYSINIAGTPLYSDSESRDLIFGKITNFSTDDEGPDILFTSQPSEYVVGSGGTRLEFTVTDETGVNTVEVAIAQIGAISNDINLDEYTLFAAEQIEGDQYAIDLLDEDFDNIGTQYFIRAFDEFGNVGISTPFPGYTYRRFPASELSLSNVATALVDDDNPEVSDFDLVAVPVTDATVSSTLGISPGDETMQMFHYDNGSVSALGGSSSINNSDGYWLIFRPSAGVDLSFGGVVPQVNNLSPLTKTLNAGWNQLGNPFPFQISWEDIYNYNVGVGNIPPNGMSSNWYGWDKNGFYDGGSGIINENQGFFIQSNEPYTIEIPLPNTLSTFFNSVARTYPTPLDAEAWKVGIDLNGEKLGYRVAAIGMHPEAKETFDPFDVRPLPHLEDYVTFNAQTESEGEDVSQHIVKTTTGYVWEFEASSNMDRQKSVLSWDNTTFGDNDRQLFLYDLESDRIVNMREESTYAFGLDQSRRFQVVFGDESFIKQHLVSSVVSVGNAYPNPFNDRITIPLTLSDAPGGYFVRSYVYNSMGQRVNTLIQSTLSQGFYDLEWDGTNDSGQELSDGIYFYKILVESSGNSDEFNGKIIFRK